MPDGSVEPEPFLDLSATTGQRLGEQGLLGLAFHPDFAKNGRFYVDYNDAFTQRRDRRLGVPGRRPSTPTGRN